MWFHAHFEGVSGSNKGLFIQYRIKLDTRLLHDLICIGKQADLSSFGRFKRSLLREGARLEFRVERVLQFDPIDSDERNDLYGNVKGTSDSIARENRVAKGLMDAPEGFAKIEFVASPFDFRDHGDGFPDDLAIGEIELDPNAFSLMHAADGDSQRKGGALGDRCCAGLDIDELNA